jgi:hypothetical protein
MSESAHSDFKFYLKSLCGMRERPSGRPDASRPVRLRPAQGQTATAAGAICAGGRCPLFRFPLTRPRYLYAAVP